MSSIALKSNPFRALGAFALEIGLLALTGAIFYSFYQGWLSGHLDMMSVEAYATYVAGIVAFAAFMFTSVSFLGPIALLAAVVAGGFAMLFSVLSLPLWIITTSSSYTANSPEFWKILFSAPIYLWLPAGLLELLRRSNA